MCLHVQICKLECKFNFSLKNYREILMMNGSAIDAAIAAGLCNGVVTPQSAGIGGGHFMTIYLA